MTSGQAQAKHPTTVLAGPYGHPLHPALVAVPIGAWVCSVVLDIASKVAHDGATASHAAWWLLGLGVLVPTAQLPGALGTVAALLPSGALGDAVRASFVDGTWPWPQWAVLGVWTLVGGGLARRFFHWSG